LIVLASSAPASAHVTVKPESTTTGSFSQLVFRVPNESDTASTVKLKVALPTKTPLLYVSVLPVPGWTFAVTKSKLPEPVESYGSTITEAPSAVTWTATGDGVKPGEYQNFAISAGPLPAVGALAFPATQTYSDGKAVKWDTVVAEGAEEPEHPAPSFVVTAEGAEAHAMTEAAEAVLVNAGSTDESTTSNTLGAIGLGVGVLALILAAFALLRGRKTQEA